MAERRAGSDGPEAVTTGENKERERRAGSEGGGEGRERDRGPRGESKERGKVLVSLSRVRVRSKIPMMIV